MVLFLVGALFIVCCFAIALCFSMKEANSLNERCDDNFDKLRKLGFRMQTMMEQISSLNARFNDLAEACRRKKEKDAALDKTLKQKQKSPLKFRDKNKKDG